MVMAEQFSLLSHISLTLPGYRIGMNGGRSSHHQGHLLDRAIVFLGRMKIERYGAPHQPERPTESGSRSWTVTVMVMCIGRERSMLIWPTAYCVFDSIDLNGSGGPPRL